jgi:putative hemolysin
LAPGAAADVTIAHGRRRRDAAAGSRADHRLLDGLRQTGRHDSIHGRAGVPPIPAWPAIGRTWANRSIRMARASWLIVLILLMLWPEPASALPNPAAVFCVQSGGRSEIRQGRRGQYGVCILPNGRVIDEWTYYRRMRGRTGR